MPLLKVQVHVLNPDMTFIKEFPKGISVQNIKVDLSNILGVVHEFLDMRNIDGKVWDLDEHDPPRDIYLEYHLQILLC